MSMSLPLSIIVNKDSYALHVCLIGLVTSKYKQFHYFQPCSLVLFFVLDYSWAAFEYVCLVRINLLKPFVELHDHLRAGHRVILPHHSAFQTVHEALV